ncbi:MAG: hypothetical protein V1800_02865 [Candidatus Latescibacterota bacterium]
MPLSLDEHRARQQNLRWAGTSITRCLRKWTIGDYLPGQVTYNLGEYPAPFSICPTDYDEQLLSECADHGVGLIQFHEEFSDPKRLLDADKFTCHDPEGLRQMVGRIHALGMKVMLYASSGYFGRTDPDFQPDWGYDGASLREFYYDYANCSPASPGWRAYVLPRMERLMDEYGVDGLYNDLGYLEIWKQKHVPAAHLSPDAETPQHDAALEDLLGIISNLVHRRGGVVKIHYEATKLPKCASKIYDYLWVGESVKNLDSLRVCTKDYPPYVVPCPDLSRAEKWNEDDMYLHALPYMHFPLRVDGRPLTGQRARVPGIDYGDDFWSEHFGRIYDWHQAHPDGPHVYGWWDTCYGRPQARQRWFHYLDLYRPMVTENTRCYLEITQSSLFVDALPETIVASLFVNEKSFLVLANYGKEPATVHTSSVWRDRESGVSGSEWILPARALKLFERTGTRTPNQM